MLRLLTALLLAATAAHAQAPEPTGAWKLDPAAVARVGDSVAEAMAAAIAPERRREILTRAKEMEAEHAALARTDPTAAQRMEPELREIRIAARAMNNPKGYFREQFMASLGDVDATLEFQDDGTLLARSTRGGQSRTTEGAWSLTGDEIELVTELPAAGGATVLHLRGPLGADRMELRDAEAAADEALLAESPGLARALREAVWVLVREP